MLNSVRPLAIFFVLILGSCGEASPEKTFGIAVLNSNMLVGFANTRMERELEQTSVKMASTKEEYSSMKRSEVVANKIRFVEENYTKLKAFSPTEDSKEIIQHSLALHELILPVYKNEYTRLAKLYDGDAPKDEIENLKQLIRDKYAAKFEALYDLLISSGKVYAEKHHKRALGILIV